MNKLRAAIAACFRRPLREDWRLHAFGGGGVIDMPHCTRDEAINAANRSGTVQFVDDEAKFIFYKPPGFNGAAAHINFEPPTKGT